MDTRSILGLPPVRTPLLVDLPAAESRKAETGWGACLVTANDTPLKVLMDAFGVMEDPNNDFDDEDESDEEDEEHDDDEDDDGEEDDEDTETWQVSFARRFP